MVEQLTAARATLPADILPPTLAPELGPHPVHFLLTGDTVPASELRDLAGRLRSDLSSTPGVATIDLCGGRDAQLQIVLDPARLAALAVPLTAILTSLRTSLQGDTLLAPGLQARVSARSLDDLTHLVVKPGPPAVTLADLARISVGADDFYLDLLFYHLRLRCYVVVELKATQFRPEYAGKLQFYLSAVDDLIRDREKDGPTIGLLLCKSKKRVIVEYTLREGQRPIGVASYQFTRALPLDLAHSLPTVDAIEAELSQSPALTDEQDETDQTATV